MCDAGHANTGGSSSGSDDEAFDAAHEALMQQMREEHAETMRRIERMDAELDAIHASNQQLVDEMFGIRGRADNIQDTILDIDRRIARLERLYRVEPWNATCGYRDGTKTSDDEAE
jgi:chromosome segregation ATPase